MRFLLSGESVVGHGCPAIIFLGDMIMNKKRDNQTYERCCKCDRLVVDTVRWNTRRPEDEYDTIQLCFECNGELQDWLAARS